VHATLIVFRLLHILSGVFWAGAVFVATGFLLPTVRATGPAGAPFMRHLMGVQKFSVRVASAAITTVLSGLVLYFIDTRLSAGAFARSRSGQVFGLGGLSAILALIPGIAITSRAAAGLTALGDAVAAQKAPPTAEQSAEMGRLQGRMAMGAKWTMALVLIALLCMAVARYV